MRSSKLLLLLFLTSIFLGGEIFLQDIKSKDEKIGRVIDINNSQLISRGVSNIGAQELVVRLEDNQEIIATNFVVGDKGVDEIYKKGDRIVVATKDTNNQITQARAISLYRLPYIKALFLIFALALLIYSKKVGVKSLISFFISILIISRFMIPAILRGDEAYTTTILTIILLTLVIIFSVAGFTKKALSAFLGTVVGLSIATLLALIFSRYMRLDGFTLPMAQGLLASGRFNLNFMNIYYASIILSASGAAMDIAMDMSASLKELREANPKLSSTDLLKASFNIGNAVVGTMSTTLLLAYTGTNITMMMFLLDRGISIYAILNGKLITSEIIRTLIGTTSLVIVAPITTIISIFISKINLRSPELSYISIKKGLLR